MEDPLVTFETTSKGKPMVRDSNNYTYVQKWNMGTVCSVKIEFEPEFLPQTYERIANIVLQYNTLPIEEYLNLIAHELSLH